MPADLSRTDVFMNRHIGPDEADTRSMLIALGENSIESFIKSVIPSDLRTDRPLSIGDPRSEFDAIAYLRTLAEKNKIYRSLFGMGYSNSITPPVIQRNILENPG